ncbi:MAG: 3-dehydroquinate synthase [Chlamydiae bacterium]|nr:3-dehydroquinate synthase [Chlamydiota bacterium]
MFESIESLKNKKYICFCDENIHALYQEKISKLGPVFVFPSGEENKTRATKEQLEDRLLEKGISKEYTFVAIGGGMTLDLIGFLASTYMRGVDVIFVPTTLLACIDASFGGKNGVNTSFGKNLIGSFYSPKQIVIDMDFFVTLSEQEIFNGLAEGIKHALIKDALFFEEIESNYSRLFEKDRAFLKYFIEKNLGVKKGFVDGANRHCLNFGHTLAHAIEAVSCYQIPHGKAVFMGMLFASQLSPLEQNEKQRILQLFDRLDVQLETFAIELLIEKMKYDKKGFGQFILLKKIGECFDTTTQFTERQIKDAFMCLSSRAYV